jgi:hypothetical protein
MSKSIQSLLFIKKEELALLFYDIFNGRKFEVLLWIIRFQRKMYCGI